MPPALTERTQLIIAVLCIALCGVALFGAIYTGNPTPFLFFAGAFGISAILLISGHVFKRIVADRNSLKLEAFDKSPHPEPLLTHQQIEDRITRLGPGITTQLPKITELITSSAAEVRPLPGNNTPLPILRMDADFNILDWNDAFGLIFDNTTEGMRGTSLYKRWVYYLDNYPQVIAEWKTNLSENGKRPRYHQEAVQYTSSRYGVVTATKRMYQVYGPNDQPESWMCAFDVSFGEFASSRFYGDLIALVRDNLLWTEYAISYDRALMNTKVYPQLLSEILGNARGSNTLPPIGEAAIVLDLGCATGNATLQLARTSSIRRIVAIDNNPLMLEFARSKCQPFLSKSARGQGVTFVRQDVTNLEGQPTEFFDVALLTNVLYAVSDPVTCLKEVFRVLKPGGEIRLTGPRSDTNTDKLLDRILFELKETGMWNELKEDYDRIDNINRYLSKKMISKWDKNVEQVAAMLIRVGFVGRNGAEIWRRTDLYADQAMMLSAFKPLET